MNGWQNQPRFVLNVERPLVNTPVSPPWYIWSVDFANTHHMCLTGHFSKVGLQVLVDEGSGASAGPTWRGKSWAPQRHTWDPDPAWELQVTGWAPPGGGSSNCRHSTFWDSNIPVRGSLANPPPFL